MNPIANKNIVSIFILALCFHFTWAQKPEVKTIDKEKGSMAELVSLRGSSFGTDATKLIVHFGAQRGTIEAVTNQLLQVRVPSGATFNNITVTNTTNGLIGYSADQFLLSFSGKHPFNISNLNSQVDFVTGVDLYDVCLCDLDNDGKSDMATANKGENSISIMRNMSTGVGNISFTEIPLAVGFPTLHVRCGDLNGDGKQDLVLTQGGTASVRDRLFILQNTSAGAGSFTFSMQTIQLTGRKNSKADIADLDLDGKPELIVTDEGSNTVAVLVNQSSLATIAFAPTPFIITIAGAASTDGLAVEDLNGDYLPEIVTSQYQTSTSKLFIIPNTSVPGTVSFGAVTTLSIGNTVKRIKIGDLDGDKKPDITVSQLLGSSLSIFRNIGTGPAISFGAPVVVVTETNPWGFDFGDFDGDGKTDIVVASVTLAKLTILNNESTPGSFSFTKQAPTILFAGRHVRVGDVDGDGKPDIAYSGIDASNPAKVGVLRNKSCVSPVINPVETPLSLCDGVLPYKLTATASRGSFFQWLKDGVPISGACGLNLNTLDVTTTTGSGKYTVKILAEGANCSTNVGCAEESAGVDITILAGTALNSNPTNNGPICIGSALNLSIANPIGGAVYKWSGPEGYSATGASQSIPNFQLVNAGTYNVDVVVGGCIAKRESTVVEVIDVPTFTISVPGSPVICQGDPSKTLTVVPAPVTFTYQWFKDGTLVGTGSSYSITSVAASSGSYTVKASYSGCTTIESAPVAIQVASLPVALFTADASACANQNVKFTNQSTFDANSTPLYIWNFGDGNTSTVKDPEHIFTTPANPYNVSLTVTYAGGACPDTETKPIVITPAPAVVITNPENKYTLCEGSPLTLEVIGTFNSYLWSTGATTPSIVVTQGGTYSVDVTTSSCTLTGNRVIDELEAPEVIVSASPEQINEGETSQLDASGLNAYAWTPTETLSNASIPNPIASPIQTTTYTVTGLGTNGCEGSGVIVVNVTGEAIVNKLTPNNFFSPNNNGPNELWTVGNILSYPQCGVTIYDDKGVKVFSAKPYQNDWNGTFNGKALPDGVYFYIIRCEGEESKPRTGSITLIR